MLQTFKGLDIVIKYMGGHTRNRSYPGAVSTGGCWCPITILKSVMSHDYKLLYSITWKTFNLIPTTNEVNITGPGRGLMNHLSLVFYQSTLSMS